MVELKKELRALRTSDAAFDELSGMPTRAASKQNSFARKDQQRHKTQRKAQNLPPFKQASTSRTIRLIPDVAVLPVSRIIPEPGALHLMISSQPDEPRPGDPIRELLPPETFEPSAVASRREAL